MSSSCSRSLRRLALPAVVAVFGVLVFGATTAAAHNPLTQGYSNCSLVNGRYLCVFECVAAHVPAASIEITECTLYTAFGSRDAGALITSFPGSVGIRVGTATNWPTDGYSFCMRAVAHHLNPPDFGIRRCVNANLATGDAMIPLA